MYVLFGRVGRGHQELQRGLSAWIVGVGKQVNEGVTLAPAPAEDAAAAKGKGKEVRDEADGDEGAAGKKRPGAAGAASAGGAVGARTKAALAWVQNVLDLKDKFDTLLARAFANDKAFEKIINDVRGCLASALVEWEKLTSDAVRRPSRSSSTRTANRPSTSRSSSTTTCARGSRAYVLSAPLLCLVPSRSED